MLEFTDWAREVIGRAAAAATRLNPDARIRLTATASGLEPRLADVPEPGDQTIEVDGVVVLADASLEGLIDVSEPHDRLVLRPGGSAPNPKPA